MAQIVIVTNRCYLLAESINHISIQEASDECKSEVPYKSSKKQKKIKKPTKKEIEARIQNAPYRVVIDFVPVARGNPMGTAQLKSSSSGDDSTEVAITVYGRDRVMALFKDMIQQIREQMPDVMFMDKLIENILNGQGDPIV